MKITVGGLKRMIAESISTTLSIEKRIDDIDYDPKSKRSKAALAQQKKEIKSAEAYVNMLLRMLTEEFPGRNRLWFPHTSLSQFTMGGQAHISIVITCKDPDLMSKIENFCKDQLEDGWNTVYVK